MGNAGEQMMETVTFLVTSFTVTGSYRRGQVTFREPVQPLDAQPSGEFRIRLIEGIVRLIRLDPKNLQSRTIRLQVDATRPGRRLGLV